jgi:type II secretory ATPase GspE/PulE/Tfp pilus assembly ATPase PilB-like protein
MADDKTKIDVGGALGWLEESEGDGQPVEATEAAEDDDDWLGLGDTISVNQSELGDRYVVEATLRRLTNKIHSSSLDEILLSLGEDLQQLLSAERVTIYVVDRIKKQLQSKAMSGDGDVIDIAVPLGPQSLAGFVAATGKVLSVADAYDDAEIKGVHELLNFDISWDQKSGFRTKQVLAVPVKAGRKTEGVIQLVNHLEDKAFGGRHKMILMEIAETLSIAFTNQKKIRVRRSKFDRLFSMQMVNEDMIGEASELAQKEGGSTEFYLNDKFHVPKKEILGSLSDYYRVTPVQFDSAWVAPTEMLDFFTVEFLKHHRCCPLGEEDGKLIVAMANPKDVPTLDAIARRLDRLGKKIKTKVALEEDVSDFIDLFYPAEEEASSSSSPVTDLSALMAELDSEQPIEEIAVTDGEDAGENSTGLMKLVNQIIIHAHQQGVSDIHIEPYPESDIVVRYRIDGVCQIYTTLPMRFRRAIISRLKIMSDLDISERRLPQDGKIKFKKYSNLDIELRVAVLPTVGGQEDCVMRILAASKPLPLDSMGFLPENLDRFKLAVAQPYGLVLVVGPTGSGKTTTLHSALGFINKPETKIWTAEDPVEITQKGLRQVQVHPKIGFNFERAMRAFLRADPDVIMIGEMRDKETAEAGVEASLTGHLVFSTLHTNSAPETVIRLLDMGLDPYSFGDSLLGVLAQRLIRRLCKSCKVKQEATPEIMATLKEEYGYDEAWDASNLDDEPDLYELKGCPKCGDKGYKGRMGIHEFMANNDELRAVIFRNGKVAEMRDLALSQGMTTLKQDGLKKVLMGHSDAQEIRRVCIK